jgi:FkbM family methyltransferase
MSGKLASLTVNGDGKSYTLSFTDGGNEQQHLLKILNGDNYILLPLEHFSPSRIFDIGAHVGAATVFFHHAYGDIPIYCFEPCRESRHHLQINTTPLKGVEVFPFGLAGSTRKAKLFHGKLHSMQNSTHVSVEVAESNHEEIELVEAKEVLSDKVGPGSILKVDTEGCELEILKNLEPYFEHLSLVYIEYHSEMDRREIDTLLAPTHSLIFSNALQLHRGNVTYIAHIIIKSTATRPSLEISR